MDTSAPGAIQMRAVLRTMRMHFAHQFESAVAAQKCCEIRER
jgi:hypothetical protein